MCYLVIVLNHMASASCLTLVLPVLVFLWATLSVPRPSKTFWMTAIIYTEVRSANASRHLAALVTRDPFGDICITPVVFRKRHITLGWVFPVAG